MRPALPLPVARAAMCLAAVGVLAGPAPAAGAGQRPARLVAERAVLVMRHGIRAPLLGEVPGETRTAAPWPVWPVPEGRITPHGARALEVVAGLDRRLLARRGLLAASGCPAPGAVRVRANSADRTIASGAAYAQGFAPGCPIAVEHRPLGGPDPIFEPLRAGATRFDAGAALAAVRRDADGPAALAARRRAEIMLLGHVLGCARPAGGCVPHQASRVAAGADGRELVLSGPIRTTSGVAQVLLLQYLEGMPRSAVGWGRVDATSLRRLSRLHAALFAVFTRPPYMAAHQAAALGREVARALDGGAGPRLTLLMGHDTNVTALAAALRVDLRATGYAVDDVPPGGAILLERVRDRRSGRAFVRVSYRTQPPGALRRLGTAVSLAPLRIPGCGGPLCPADRFARLLGRLAPLAGGARS